MSLVGVELLLLALVVRGLLGRCEAHAVAQSGNQLVRRRGQLAHQHSLGIDDGLDVLLLRLALGAKLAQRGRLQRVDTALDIAPHQHLVARERVLELLVRAFQRRRHLSDLPVQISQRCIELAPQLSEGRAHVALGRSEALQEAVLVGALLGLQLGERARGLGLPVVQVFLQPVHVRGQVRVGLAHLPLHPAQAYAHVAVQVATELLLRGEGVAELGVQPIQACLQHRQVLFGVGHVLCHQRLEQEFLLGHLPNALFAQVRNALAHVRVDLGLRHRVLCANAVVHRGQASLQRRQDGLHGVEYCDDVGRGVSHSHICVCHERRLLEHVPVEHALGSLEVRGKLRQRRLLVGALLLRTRQL